MDVKLTLKTLVCGTVPGFAGMMIAGAGPAAVMISNCFFSAGFAIGAIGLWRIIRRLSFFDGAVYSFKSFLAQTGRREYVKPDCSRAEYFLQNQYKRPFLELMLAALICFIISWTAALAWV